MMKKFKFIIPVTLITAMLLTGCSSATSNNTGSTSNSASTSNSTSTSASDNSDTSTATTLGTSTVVVNKEFTANDLEVGYEDSTATHITLDGSNIEVSGDGADVSDGVLTISSEGTYVITGTLTDGQIVVNAGAEDKIQIVLNGVTITCSDSAPIYVKSADKVFITLEENTVNTLTDGSNYVQTDDNTVDAVIFSTADLTLNGKGTLNVNGNYKHGIISKDDLVFTGGTYNITAVKDAINGKESVKIQDGTFALSAANGNGIQSKNGEDNTTGYVYISGGNVTIAKSVEGIEGTAIVIEGGNIDITSSDDGINATSGSTSTVSTQDTTTDMSSTDAGVIEVSTASMATDSTADAESSATVPSDDQDFAKDRGDFGGFGGKGGFGGGGGMENDTNAYLSISGGTVKVNASGDGLDSNGSVYISGGEIYVSGPTENNNAGLDYNGTADITGGTIIVAGSSGMAQGFSDTSTQYSLLYNLTNSAAAGTEVTLTDKDGNVVASFTPDKSYQSVVISSPELKNSETYTLTCGDQTADITLSSIVTSNGATGGFGMGGMQRPSRGN